MESLRSLIVYLKSENSRLKGEALRRRCMQLLDDPLHGSSSLPSWKKDQLRPIEQETKRLLHDIQTTCVSARVVDLSRRKQNSSWQPSAVLPAFQLEIQNDQKRTLYRRSQILSRKMERMQLLLAGGESGR